VTPDRQDAAAETAWVLWYRPSVRQKGVRRQWEPVAECATERECTDAMEASGKPHGQWITLPKGKRP
jgi:hypothetical protein